MDEIVENESIMCTLEATIENKYKKRKNCIFCESDQGVMRIGGRGITIIDKSLIISGTKSGRNL